MGEEAECFLPEHIHRRFAESYWWQKAIPIAIEDGRFCLWEYHVHAQRPPLSQPLWVPLQAKEPQLFNGPQHEELPKAQAVQIYQK